MATFNVETTEWVGVTEPGFLNPRANLGQVILSLLDRNPNEITQISAESGVKVTCREMRLRTARVAQNLIKLGYKKGDMVAIANRNHENLAPVVFGCFCIGASINGLDPFFDKANFAHMLGVTKPVLIFCEEDNIDVIKEAAESVKLHPKYMVFGSASSDSNSVDVILNKTESDQTYYPSYLGDSKDLLAFVVCSSGTTGAPKGVCLSHAQLIQTNTSINFLNIYFGKFTYFSSLYWVSGIWWTILSVYNNITRVITTNKFSSDVALEIIKNYRVEYMFTPPPLIATILQNERISEIDMSCMKYIITGGAKFSETAKCELMKHLPNGRIVYAYGLSEMGGLVSSNFLNQRVGSSGQVLPNMRVKIIDDDGVPQGVGKTGELTVKWVFSFMGYYGNEKATRECLLADGWLKTGDIGYFDEDGFLFIVDRKKEIFKYNMYHIFPNEIESVIAKYEGVLHVCVVGVTDEKMQTSLPAAVIEKKMGATFSSEDIQNFVDANVSDAKKLRGGVYFIDSIPMTISGKLKRTVIRDFADKSYKSAML